MHTKEEIEDAITHIINVFSGGDGGVEFALFNATMQKLMNERMTDATPIFDLIIDFDTLLKRNKKFYDVEKETNKNEPDRN
jgi:hypothetical protein